MSLKFSVRGEQKIEREYVIWITALYMKHVVIQATETQTTMWSYVH